MEIEQLGALKLYDEFRAACNRWALINIGLQQESIALDYGLFGILSFFESKINKLPDASDSRDVKNRMQNYIDELLASSDGFTALDREGRKHFVTPNTATVRAGKQLH